MSKTQGQERSNLELLEEKMICVPKWEVRLERVSMQAGRGPGQAGILNAAFWRPGGG